MDEINDAQPIKLNSKGKAYRNGVGPTPEQLKELKMMRLRASDVLKAKKYSNSSQKRNLQKGKDARPTRHFKEKNERNEVINKILEEKNKEKKKQ